MTRTVLLLAGEASGDEHGGALAAALVARLPGLRLVGTGGPHMERAGVALLAGLDDLAVMGFAEVLPRLPALRALERRIHRVLDESAVDLVVPIDYPGFNLRIARAAHRRGIKVLYYIAPKVWAWRAGRAKALARTTDRVAAILPFEEPLLAAAGVRAEYVGHPLLDRFEAGPRDGSESARGDPAAAPGDRSGAGGGDRDFRGRWGLDAERPLLALLPGSREQEIARHLDLFVSAADGVRAARPDVVAVVSRACSVGAAPFEGLGLPVVDDTPGLLRHASAALVKSGTSTLEAALERTPMVVAYRTSAPTWALARAFLRTEHVALPNLIAGESVVPEYLQGSARPDTLAAALLPLLDGGSRERRAQLEGFDAVRRALGAGGTTDRVADLAIRLMEGN